MTTAEQPLRRRSGARAGASAALGLPRPRGAVDLRGRPAALRPAEGQPGVLRRARAPRASTSSASRCCSWWCRRLLLLAIELLVGSPARRPAQVAHLRLHRAARGADRRAGAEEGDRRLRRRADRPLGRDRRGAGRCLYAARRAGALVPAASCRRRRWCSSRCSCSRDPISKLPSPTRPQARTIGGVTQAPIVVVLLDELPSNTLVDEKRAHRRAALSGFGELARNATWFRNAYTVYDSTERAQPAIMDGNLPTKDKLPTSADHPNSIFSLFAKTHRLNVSEEATSSARATSARTAPRRAVWRADQLDDRGPRARVAARGLAARHRGRPRVACPRTGATSAAAAEAAARTSAATGAERQTPAPTSTAGARRASRSGSTRSSPAPARAELQAHAAAARALAVPARRHAVPATGQRRDPGLLEPVVRGQCQLDVLLQRHFLQTGFADHELQELWRT